ncbi:hypothetical protein [Aquimarina aggregata]|uniref:hypothetical protein n=1 Tax=Aquimarina aggregata TaxID=1642818 RepID=UPI000A9AD2BB|nr:hypothetical protein [Aquimarina aggregata]
MLPDDINDLPPEILYGVLRILKIDISEFMYRLLNDHPHEIMMYIWIYKQYHMYNPKIE